MNADDSVNSCSSDACVAVIDEQPITPFNGHADHTSSRRRRRRSYIVAITAVSLAVALFQPSLALAQPTPYDAAVESMRQRTATERTAAAGRADRKVWDYVIADRTAKTVTLLACATTIKPTDPAEFFVTTLASGKDYEALSVTPAKPADVRAAMDFIGLQPGRPIDPETNRFWPRGPRVTMTMALAGKSVRAETLVLDASTNQPLPTSGLVYTGSFTYTDPQGRVHVAADDSDARPIAPTYNDPAALFDVPAQALQGAVYGYRKPSPAFTPKPGEQIDITLAAAVANEAIDEHALEVVMTARHDKIEYAIALFPAVHGGRVATTQTTQAHDLPHLIAEIATAADGTRDLFTTVAIGPDVRVSDVRNLYAVLQAVEKDRGVKLDAPRPGGLFHRAFFPDADWRDRGKRLGEPWELRLDRGADGKLSAKLERSVDHPDRNAAERKVVESFTPADAAGFVAHVNANASRWSRAIFVYPPADLTYGELMSWADPVLATYPRVFVFPAAQTATQPTP